MKYILLFILIQIIALVLAVIGVPICAWCAWRGPWCYQVNWDRWSYPRWADWLYGNQEDGVCPGWYIIEHPNWSLRRVAFYWTALRNPVNNLRYLPGISRVGRPLWRKTWSMLGKRYYVQAGWNGRGHPVLSGGINIHND